ncbi:MAG: hypothetical protein PF450_13630, partial [Bacteroidales bacterium]|nr:hypothetical protein [Bacteroidales bacterium]
MNDHPIWNSLKYAKSMLTYAQDDDVDNAMNAYNEVARVTKGMDEMTYDTYSPSIISDYYKSIRDSYYDLLDTGEWFARPAEVLLPNTFKKEFGFKAGETITLSEIEADPLFFVKRRIFKGLNLNKTLEWQKENLVKKNKVAANDPELENIAYKIWVAAHPNQSGIDQEFLITYANEIKHMRTGLSKHLHQVQKGSMPDLMHFKQMHKYFLQAMAGDSARIPGTGMPSAGPIKVVGFMEGLDNAVGIPIESMIVKGEDLDIDKANIQLYEVSNSNQEPGKVFDFYTWVNVNGKLQMRKNDYSGTMATKSEIAEHPDFKNEFIRNEEIYTNTDWWVKGNKNFITGLTIQILSDGRNAIAANRPVDTAVSSKYANDSMVDMFFSPNNPMSSIFMSTINKVGGKMIGIEATALKGYSAIYQMAQKLINKGHLGTTPKNNGVGTLIDASFDGKKYYSVADTTDRYRLETTLTKMTQDQRDAVQDEINQMKEDQRMEEKAWAAYSELINAATDNAKLLILGRINMNPDTSNIMNTLIAFGVPFKRALDFVNSDSFKGIVTTINNSDRKVNPKSIMKLMEDGDNTVAELADEFGLTDDELVYWFTLADSFSSISINLGINQGLKTTPEDFFKFQQRINKSILESLGKKAFTLQQYFSSNTSDLQREDMLGILESTTGKLNLFRVLEENSHFKSFYRGMVQAREVIDEIITIPKTADALIAASMTRGGNPLQSFDDLGTAHLAAQSFIFKVVADTYLQANGKIPTGIGAFDLRTTAGRTDFLRSFSTIVADMTSRYPNNAFVNKLKPVSQDFAGSEETYDVYSIGDVKNDSNMELHKIHLGMLSSEDKQVLHMYSLLLDGGVSKHSFAPLFSPEVTQQWNKVLGEFKGIDKITDDMVDYFLDSNPMLYTKMDADELDEHIKDINEENIGRVNPISPEIQRVKYWHSGFRKMVYVKWSRFNNGFNTVPVSMSDAFKGIPFESKNNYTSFFSTVTGKGSKQLS